MVPGYRRAGAAVQHGVKGAAARWPGWASAAMLRASPGRRAADEFSPAPRRCGRSPKGEGRMRGGFAGGGWLRLLPAVTVAIFLLPVVAGLLGTLLPSLGYLPELGGRSLSLDAWRMLM